MRIKEMEERILFYLQSIGFTKYLFKANLGWSWQFY